MKKMDEMELNINIKGIKWSWFFLVISLFVWGVYEYVKTQVISMPLILLTSQYLVYFFVTNIAKLKMGDERGKNVVGWYFGGALFLIIVFGIILFLATGRK